MTCAVRPRASPPAPFSGTGWQQLPFRLIVSHPSNEDEL